MYAPPFTDSLAKVHIDKLVDVRTNKCLSCKFQLKSGCEVGHYKVEHFHLLKEIAKQNDDEPSEERMPMEEPNPGSDNSSVATTDLPQASTPLANCGTSGGGSRQRHLTTSADVAKRARPIKQELLPRDEDDDVVVMFDQAAAPYFVKSHGAGLRLLIRDTKDLSRENVNLLLSLLVPPERAPAANACPRLKFEPVNTGGTRIEVEDTGLLTATQLAAVRRAISGTTDIASGGQPQERVNTPYNPDHQPAYAIAHAAANAPTRRGRPPKDPNAPKRARTAYQFFLQDYRSPIHAAALQWKQLSDEERWPFIERANEDKERYEAEHTRYNLDTLLQSLNLPANGEV